MLNFPTILPTWTENWLFKLKNDNATFLYLAFQDETYSGDFYEGAILNTPTIRESINLVKSTAKTGNISIKVADYQYKGAPLSEELFGGSNNYINHETTVHARVNSETPVQIGNFRLIELSMNGKDIIISFTAHRPWDFISIPQTQSDNGIYEPVAYGDFTNNPTPSFCDGYSVFPMPYIGTRYNDLYYAETQGVGSGHESHFYDKLLDKFTTINSEDTATSVFNSLNCIGIPLEFSKTVRVRPLSVESSSGFSNAGNAIDGTTSAATASGSVQASSVGSDPSPAYSPEIINNDVINFNLPEIDGEITSLKVYIFGSITQSATDMGSTNTGTFPSCSIQTFLYSNADSVLTRISDSNGTTNTSGTNINLTDGSGSGSTQAFSVSSELVGDYDTTKKLDLLKLVMYYHSGTGDDDPFAPGYSGQDPYGATFSVSIKDVMIAVSYGNDLVNEPVASYRNNAETEFVYSGSDGLSNGITGLSGIADTVHEVHLDLLNRYAGLDVATNPATDIDGWTSLNTDRSGWSARFWAVDDTELKKILERIQYEGCFIFRYKADGNPQYIHVVDSPSPDHTITANDVQNMNVQPSPFSELVTKRTILYEKHPAVNKYLSSLETEDTTNNPRADYNIQTKENIETVKLDILVANIGDTNPGDDDPNDSFAGYYNNLYGTIKLMVSGKIVNPAFYGMEVGDIIDFDSTNIFPAKAFNTSWSGLNFMITSLSRSVGQMNFTARQI